MDFLRQYPEKDFMAEAAEAVGDVALDKPCGPGPGVAYLPQRGMTPSPFQEPVRSGPSASSAAGSMIRLFSPYQQRSLERAIADITSPQHLNKRRERSYPNAAYLRCHDIINDITIPRDLPGLTGNRRAGALSTELP
jgi:hypothetical protein